MKDERKFTTNMLVKMALMTAVSLVLLMIVRIPFPLATWLVYDPADVPIYITSFAMGPVAGLIITFVVCIIQAFALGGDGIYGFAMHFIATGIVAVLIGTMYKRNKTKKTAIIALITGVIACVVIMAVLNVFVTSAYFGMPKEAVVAMLPTIIIPFNILKAGLNSILTFILYKRLSGFLHNEHSFERKSKDNTAE